MTASTKTNIAIVVLAAGASSRLGSPKQLLCYRGNTLLQHTINAAVHSSCDPIVVIVPDDKDFALSSTSQIQIHTNRRRRQGVSTSIHCGVEAVRQLAPETKAIIFMVCDQPLVSSSLLNKITAAYTAGQKPIVACEYAGTVGVPALFEASLFDELLELSGDRGAKKIIRCHFPTQVTTVPFPQGAVDVDTVEDYQRLVEARKGFR